MTVEAPAYPVRFEVDDVAPQGRLSILFRWLLIIPHVIILALLGIAVGIVIMLAWFAIVFAGRSPAALVRFTIGYARWAARVNAYGSLLTGAYPPFSMEEEPDYPVRLTVPERTTGRSPADDLLSLPPPDPARDRAVLPRHRRHVRGVRGMAGRGRAGARARRSAQLPGGLHPLDGAGERVRVPAGRRLPAVQLRVGDRE